MTRSVLRIGVMELRRRPGTQREVHVATPLPGLAITSAQVPEGAGIVVDGTLEAIEGAVTLSGTVTAPWTGECRRCLDPVVGTLEVALSEVFEPHPTDGETYPIEGDEVDLEPVVRDGVLLHLPLAPLCRPDCPGPAPDVFPTIVEADGTDVEDDGAATERPPDPRWAALDQLKFD
ncbi:MAG: YceD family protein [Acidimicrobiales bacterium]